MFNISDVAARITSPPMADPPMPLTITPETRPGACKERACATWAAPSTCTGNEYSRLLIDF
jgi:hypothetical protein